MSFVSQEENSAPIIDACLDSYIIISTPSPKCKSSRTNAIGSPSPQRLRTRRMRALTSLTVRDFVRDATVHSIDINQVSQPVLEDNLLSLSLENIANKRKLQRAAGVPIHFSKLNPDMGSIHRVGMRERSHTVIGASYPLHLSTLRRSKGNVKRTIHRRATQPMFVMPVRKAPILPARFDESILKLGTIERKSSASSKRSRRRSEPFLFNSTGKLRKASVALPGRQCHTISHKRRISTSNALLPSANKIRLQELANTELLASLNEPFGKNESEQEVSEDEKDEEDYPALERESEQQKLTALKRVKVIEEIFETEKKYLACLNTLDKVFKAPLLDSGIAQEKDVNNLFPSCLSTIKECHSWFMEQLENRMKSEDWSGSIGDILGKMAGPLKENLLNFYTDYVNSFPKSISTFSKCSRGSHKFRKFIEDCYCKSDNLDLPSYLITPVQRLPRYVLLLRQLSKYTHEDHPDSESIQRALKQMEELISSLNSSIHNSMHAYTTRESETRKTIRRQLSRRRKKPRPLSLNLKDMRATEEKSNKAASHDQNDNRLPRFNSASDKCKRDTEGALNDEKDAQGNVDTQLLKIGSLSNDAQVPTVQLRKNKQDGRKSFRRSLGAALSSLWSPRDDKDTKNAQENRQDERLKMDDAIKEDEKARESIPLRRKVGVSYPIPSQFTDSNDAVATETPKSEDEVVKRRRFSESFRERTRNFRIQMRRRSGSWFTAAAEKSSDLDLTSNSSSATNIPSISVSEDILLDDSSVNVAGRSNKNKSPFVSIFGKRKTKYYSDENGESVTRWRSECGQQLDPDELLDKQLSKSVSAPLMTYPNKETKESTLPEIISEETVENINEAKGVTSTDNDVRSGKSSFAESVMENDSPLQRENSGTSVTEKKNKKGKIMKTLRNFVGKGKN